jgi:guanylate kinase
VVVCGPSGVGKGTIIECLRERYENIRLSVSATTRSPRQGEVNGKNYFFKTTEEFKDMINNDELIEWVEYCGNFYGTPRKYVEECIRSGFDVIMEIEVEGAANIKKKFPDNVSIFILPPSFEVLKNRIEGRGTEKPETIVKRLEIAKREILSVDKYDYVLINNTVEETADELRCILISEKLKFNRNTDILKQIGIL